MYELVGFGNNRILSLLTNKLSFKILKISVISLEVDCKSSTFIFKLSTP